MRKGKKFQTIKKLEQKTYEAQKYIQKKLVGYLIEVKKAKRKWQKKIKQETKNKRKGWNDWKIVRLIKGMSRKIS